MRKFFLLITIIFISSSIYAQSKPPKKIREAFDQMNPTAREVAWTHDGERQKVWEAKYNVGNDSLLARYDYKANWIIRLTYMTIEKLPEAVTYAINDEYQGCKLKLGARLEEPEFDGFGVAFDYKDAQWAVQITGEGKVIRRKMTASGFDF